MRVKAGKFAPHAASRLERLHAMLAGRGDWLFHSNELQRNHAQPQPCNLPRSALTLGERVKLLKNKKNQGAIG